MREAVSHAISGIAAGVNRKAAFQFVVSGSVQQISDGHDASHSSSEKDQLTCGSALTERPCHWVQFFPSIAQIAMGDVKVHSFQRGVAGKECFIGCIPKFVFCWNLGKSLSRRYRTDEKNNRQEKMKCSAPFFSTPFFSMRFHGPNLRVER